MRELKFRGLTKKDEWVSGSLVQTNKFIKHMPKQHTKNWIVASAFGNGGWFNVIRRHHVKDDTVGQYTGLKDKNGVEIYEGDIVSSSFTIYQNYPNDESDDVTRIGIVKYYPSKGFVTTKVTQISDTDGAIKKNICPMNIVASNTIVIGNIHQDEQLLEVDK